MSCKAVDLPSNVHELLALLAEKDGEIARLTREAERQQARFQALQEQINLLIAKRFGRSSEKLSADQLGLFNEAETTAPADPEPEAIVSVPAHQRVRPGRKPLPEALPRIDVIHELPAEERICAHDGEGLIEIGEEISEQPELQGRNAFGRYRKNSTSSRHRSGSFGTCGKNTPVRTAKWASRPQRSRPNRCKRAWPRPGSWRISRSRSTRMPCPSIGRSTS